MLFDDGAGDDADVQFFGESAIVIEVFLRLRTEGDEAGVGGEPVREMIFGEDG